MPIQKVELTKREVALMAHVLEHFNDGFNPEDLAASLGWPVAEVEDALNVCALFGLLDGPGAAELRDSVVGFGGPMVTPDDFLTPEELEAAKKGRRQ